MTRYQTQQAQELYDRLTREHDRSKFLELVAELIPVLAGTDRRSTGETNNDLSLGSPRES